MRAKVQNFHKRWNIEYNKKKRVKDFKNRVLSSIDLIITPVFAKSKNLSLLLKYFKLISIYVSKDDLYYLDLDSFEEYEGKDVFKENFKFKIEKASLEETIFYLQQLFWLYIPKYIKDRLYKSIKEDIELSQLDVEIKKLKNGGYIFYPAGAKLLDEGVVNDVLDWLSDYPESYKNFKIALEQYEKHKYTRNIIDNLRFSLESLLKNVLHNRKSLEKQIEPLGQYLEAKEIPTEIREMFRILIIKYRDYQNEHAKHNDSIGKSEIEFMIYLTGTFIRFILNLEVNLKGRIVEGDLQKEQ